MAKKLSEKNINRTALIITLSILVAIFVTVISLQQATNTTQYAAGPTPTIAMPSSQ